MSQPDRGRFRMTVYWIWLAVILAFAAIPAVVVEVSAWLLNATPGCSFSFKGAGAGCDPQLHAIYVTSFLTLALTLWVTIMGVPIWLLLLGIRYLTWRMDAAKPNTESPAMTLKTRIIPCLDVKDGRVVKGVQFVDLVDAGDPVEAAIAYDAAGADELTFLDITASHENRETIFDVVARTAEHCFMPVTVGGGIRKLEDIRKLLLAGADKVSINSAAVSDPDFIARAADKFGDQCIVVSVDARRRQTQAPGGQNMDDWEIFTHGGRNPTGLDAVEFAARMVERGAGELLVTSMDRDGTKSGFDLKLTRAIADAVTVPVIASGGVGTLADLVDGVKEGHASAVLAASIFHFGTYTVGEAKAYMEAHGIPMRHDASEIATE